MDMFDEMLSKGGLSLDRLRNFCRIAEAGGIAKAAGGDPGRQSLYSRQIKELEAFFGVELKVRRGKGIVLTDAGQQLARLARAHLLGLADFRRTARKMPQRISIGSGNSVIEWVLVPGMSALSKALPEARFECYGERTRVIVSSLLDLTLDLGIIREDAVRRPLKSIRLTSVAYSLFVPKKLSPGLEEANLCRRLNHIPLATAMGGQFRGTLETGAEKLGWPLKIVISCSSFTQAARLVLSGNYGGVLPSIAKGDFDASRVVEIPLPFLKNYSRMLCLAWNPRLVEVRPFIALAVEALSERIPHLGGRTFSAANTRNQRVNGMPR
jgi:DNA-binding transcriptional LysR family regulator